MEETTEWVNRPRHTAEALAFDRRQSRLWSRVKIAAFWKVFHVHTSGVIMMQLILFADKCVIGRQSYVIQQ